MIVDCICYNGGRHLTSVGSSASIARLKYLCPVLLSSVMARGNVHLYCDHCWTEQHPFSLCPLLRLSPASNQPPPPFSSPVCASAVIRMEGGTDLDLSILDQSPCKNGGSRRVRSASENLPAEFASEFYGFTVAVMLMMWACPLLLSRCCVDRTDDLFVGRKKVSGLAVYVARQCSVKSSLLR